MLPFESAITGVLRDGEQIPLCRLRYGGSAHSFGFAIYSHAAGRYEDAVLLTGSPVGTPQEALDTACTLYLTDTSDKPAPDPRRINGRDHLGYPDDAATVLVAGVPGPLLLA